MLTDRRTDALKEESGSLLIILAIALPVLLLFLGLVVEVGNWYHHKRHLQLQADAGALAGGDLFARCFASDQTAANTAIKSEALKYAGDPAQAARFNPQPGLRGSEGLVFLINKKSFDRGGPPPDDTNTAEPCAAAMVDMKLSDEDVPWFLRAANVSVINAHARVEARKVAQIEGTLPIAMPDLPPKKASVRFYNENTGATLVTTSLDGPTIANGLAQFTMTGNSTVSVNVPAGGGKVGVQVNLGGQNSTTPGDDYVLAYGCPAASDPGCVSGGAGLSLIHANDTCASPNCTQPNPPKPLRVWPLAGPCTSSTVPTQPDPRLFAGANLFYAFAGNFSPYFATCSVGIAATVDFGTGAIDPTLAKSAGGVRAVVTASISTAGASNNFPCTPSSVSLTWSAGVWSTPSNAFSCPGQWGPMDVNLHLEEQEGAITGINGNCSTSNGNKCKWDYAGIQRVYSAGRDTSGPIKVLTITEPGSSATGSPLSLAPGAHSLRVAVGTQYLRLAGPTNPAGAETFGLRVANTSGSQNQAFKCNPTLQLKDSIIQGCPAYQRNPNTPGCPETSPPTPPDCITVDNSGAGDKIGQLSQAMDIRLGKGGSCTINNWPNPPDGDPRAIPLIITDFGAFQNSGSNSQYPVRRFGVFYVTGWTGSNCATNETYPWSNSNQATHGDIWGHFIFDVEDFNNGGASGDLCTLGADPSVIDPCIAVLTR